VNIKITESCNTLTKDRTMRKTEDLCRNSYVVTDYGKNI